jgi:hypothetical protein
MLAANARGGYYPAPGGGWWTLEEMNFIEFRILT